MFAWLNGPRGRSNPPTLGADRFLEALRLDRCPICFLRDMFGIEYIRNLLLESVNDGRMRERLLKAGGFCRHHAWKAAVQGDRLGMAILYECLLDDQLRGMGSVRWRIFRGGRECPACSYEREVEKAYASQVVNWWMADDGFRKTLKERSGFCVGHARRVLEGRMAPEFRREMLKVFRSKGEMCLSDLRGFLTKQNIVVKAMPTLSEEQAWKEAIRLVAGDKD